MAVCVAPISAREKAPSSETDWAQRRRVSTPDEPPVRSEKMAGVTAVVVAAEAEVVAAEEEAEEVMDIFEICSEICSSSSS